MRIIFGIALASTLMSAGSASAQIVDMRTATCNDFIGFKRDITFAIAMWLDADYLAQELQCVCPLMAQRGHSAMSACSSAFGGKADMPRPRAASRSVANDP